MSYSIPLIKNLKVNNPDGNFLEGKILKGLLKYGGISTTYSKPVRKSGNPLDDAIKALFSDSIIANGSAPADKIKTKKGALLASKVKIYFPEKSPLFGYVVAFTLYPPRDRNKAETIVMATRDISRDERKKLLSFLKGLGYKSVQIRIPEAAFSTSFDMP